MNLRRRRSVVACDDDDFEDENDAFQVKRMMIERRDDDAFAFADGNRTRATTSTMSSSSFSLLCSFVSKSEGKRSPLTPIGKSNVSAMVHRTARYDYSYYYYYSKTITARIARTKTRLVFSRSGNIFHFHPRDSNAEARQLTSRAVHDGIRDE